MEELHLDPLAEATAPGVTALFNRLYPRWFDCDAMAYQKRVAPPHFEADQLHAREAHELAALVRELWA